MAAVWHFGGACFVSCVSIDIAAPVCMCCSCRPLATSCTGWQVQELSGPVCEKLSSLPDQSVTGLRHGP